MLSLRYFGKLFHLSLPFGDLLLGVFYSEIVTTNSGSQVAFTTSGNLYVGFAENMLSTLVILLVFNYQP